MIRISWIQAPLLPKFFLFNSSIKNTFEKLVCVMNAGDEILFIIVTLQVMTDNIILSRYAIVIQETVQCKKIKNVNIWGHHSRWYCQLRFKVARLSCSHEHILLNVKNLSPCLFFLSTFWSCFVSKFLLDFSTFRKFFLNYQQYKVGISTNYFSPLLN